MPVSSRLRLPAQMRQLADRVVSQPLFRLQLRRAAPGLFWFRHGHRIEDDELIIFASVACRKRSICNAQITADVDNRPATVAFRPATEAFRNAFWYLPESHIADLEIRADAAVATSSEPGQQVSEFQSVTLQSPAFDPDTMARSFILMPPKTVPASTPPRDNIQRVSGRGATEYNYWNNGRTDFVRFSEIARRHGMRVDDPSTRILDWGCGCARLTRHWLALENGPARITGADIDPVNIDWCRAAFPKADFRLSPLHPPVDFGGEFDVIVGNSVLTHLQLDVMQAWLAALSSKLSEGGVALLSYHGNFSLATICSRNRHFWQTVQRAGFDASMQAEELNDALEDKQYYRQTFMTDQFARALFSRWFSLEAVYRGVVSRYQNVAVLRKRPRA